MRIEYGFRYRVYYQEAGDVFIILLCGGDKTTQDADIAKAREIAAGFNGDEEGKNNF
ncbi:hypothetical protein FACS1894161_4680 [Spirochaetia bacterium]|nr:hypothetical protein FACS1894161_4680 [Spirochaetia bacterium]